MFGSTDGGLNWAHLGSGPLANVSVWALNVTGTTLLAGTEAKGIWSLPL